MNHTLPECILLSLFFFVSVTFGADETKMLLGRWRADTVPTGYWIIDRYADGRYAEKSFLSYDYSKPSEVVISWGRWKVKGKKYAWIIDGSTSQFIQRFVGKWKSKEISAITSTRFGFVSSDGHDRTEEVYENKTKLVKLPMKAPPDLSGPNLTIIKTPLNTIPDWVRSADTP